MLILDQNGSKPVCLIQLFCFLLFNKPILSISKTWLNIRRISQKTFNLYTIFPQIFDLREKCRFLYITEIFVLSIYRNKSIISTFLLQAWAINKFVCSTYYGSAKRTYLLMPFLIISQTQTYIHWIVFTDKKRHQFFFICWMFFLKNILYEECE